LRIVRLQAENVKRLKLVDITPGKYITRITGGNGEGKTSVLDSIEWALTGARNVPSMPVRKGTGKAVIRLDLGDIVVTRKLIEGSTKRAGYLAVEDKNGKAWKDPGEMLAALMGAISFDPLAFTRMAARAQFDTLAHIAAPDVDLDALEEQTQADYDRRTIVKKEREAVTTRRDAIAVPADLPAEKYDEAALVNELAKVSDYNAGIDRAKREREKFADEMMEISKDIFKVRNSAISLRQQAAELDKQADAAEARMKESEAKMAAWEDLPEPKDASEVAERINQARIINAAIDRRATREILDREVAAKQAEWEKLDEAVKRGEREKNEALANAKYPIEGLSFDTAKKEVVYNDIPFDQASQAEQIKISMAIGMATNPQLRVMRIKDGSLLDSSSLDVIAAMAKDNDFQIWIEQVDTTGKVGIYLEDGEVKAVNEEGEPKPKSAAKKRATKEKIPATA
jgi:DNA repair exonuclease SbcCD ATPase subunit